MYHSVLPSVRVVKLFSRRPHPRPKLVYPHQKSIGRTTIKKVCVPRLAVNAKYESRAGVRSEVWRDARYGVSQRTKGMSHCRGI